VIKPKITLSISILKVNYPTHLVSVSQVKKFGTTKIHFLSVLFMDVYITVCLRFHSLQDSWNLIIGLYHENIILTIANLFSFWFFFCFVFLALLFSLPELSPDNGDCNARESRICDPSHNIVTSRRQHNFSWWHNMVCCPVRCLSNWFAECIRLDLWSRHGRLQSNPRGWSVFWSWHASFSCLLCFQQLLPTKWEFWNCLQFRRNCRFN